MTDTLSLVRAYHDAWTTKRIDEAAGYLADDLDFQGMINRFTTAAQYTASLREFVRIVERVDLLAAFAHDDEAMLLHDTVTGPFGTMRTAEHFVVKDGKIRQLRQIYDATLLRSAVRDPQGLLQAG